MYAVGAVNEGEARILRRGRRKICGNPMKSPVKGQVMIFSYDLSHSRRSAIKGTHGLVEGIKSPSLT